jgi:hypothetical protein
MYGRAARIKRGYGVVVDINADDIKSFVSETGCQARAELSQANN